MLLCWNKKPKSRPTFLRLIQIMLNHIAEKETFLNVSFYNIDRLKAEEKNNNDNDHHNNQQQKNVGKETNNNNNNNQKDETLVPLNGSHTSSSICSSSSSSLSSTPSSSDDEDDDDKQLNDDDIDVQFFPLSGKEIFDADHPTIQQTRRLSIPNDTATTNTTLNIWNDNDSGVKLNNDNSNQLNQQPVSKPETVVGTAHHNSYPMEIFTQQKSNKLTINQQTEQQHQQQHNGDYHDSPQSSSEILNTTSNELNPVTKMKMNYHDHDHDHHIHKRHINVPTTNNKTTTNCNIINGHFIDTSMV